MGGRQRTTSSAEGAVQREVEDTGELAAQNRAVQREAGGSSKLVAQYNSELRVTLPVFPENIPRKDTGSRDEESDQRVCHGAWAKADFEKVLEKIDATIEGAGVIIPDTSKVKFQGAFYGKGLIDVAVQDVGVTSNLNIVHSMQDVGTRLDVGSPKFSFKLGGDPTEVSKLKRTNRNFVQRE